MNYKIKVKDKNKAIVKGYSPDKVLTVVFNTLEGEAESLAREYVAFKSIGKGAPGAGSSIP